MNQRIVTGIIVLFLIVIVSLPALGLQDEPQNPLGDVNMDMRVDSIDMVQMARYLTGEAIDIYIGKADMDYSGDINSQDYSLLKRKLIKEPTRFDVGGIIQDVETGESIENVSVKVNTLYEEYVPHTDQYGEWSLNALYGTVTIVPMKVGYTFEPSKIEISSSDNNIVFSGKKVLNDNSVISFTNDNLEMAIREELDILSGNIYYSDLVDIQELSLDNKNISSIEGIQYFTNLKHLTLENNKIEDISPFYNMTHLVTLNLRNNEISDIRPIVYLRKLEELILGENNIKSISPGFYSKNLDNLELDNNKIIDMMPLYADTCKKVDLSNNQIENFRYGILSENLEELYLDDNQISNLNAFVFEVPEDNPYPNLKILSMNNNNLDYIDFLGGLESINYLGLIGNQITDIGVIPHLDTLEAIDINNNKLDISEGSETMTIINDLINNGCDVSYKPQN